MTSDINDRTLPFSPEAGGRLADNIVVFARALRASGLKFGPGSIADALKAVSSIQIGSRDEFYAALRCVLVKRREDQPLFDAAFALFWRSGDLVEAVSGMRTPVQRLAETGKTGDARIPGSGVFSAGQDGVRRDNGDPLAGADTGRSGSGSDALHHTDFARMTAAELLLAKKALSELVLPFDDVRTRRFRPSHRQKVIDPRATMREAMGTGGDLILPRFREPRYVPPPLVILADISGSMSQYTRIFLHFLHVLTEKHHRVHTFLFGTRLTNVTRQMRSRSPDTVMDACASAVLDWSGGTRIGQTLADFNRLWSRRVLGQGAVVLLITDGLERGETQVLEWQMARLHRSCRRLIWLNPLLRFDGFAARARGVRAMLPHVDEFRAVHNLAAISDIAAALSGKVARDADPRRYMDEIHRTGVRL
ncbi:MAG: VWA domain-containing protein [Pararhizobium sp.]|nr:VWA domain-containing protein [Pararhizobium sp.]MDO9417139.1 VWA domain-containing protein [Pararhizobium sp.]